VSSCAQWRTTDNLMDLETLANGKYLSLTTFRRDGTPVATPVWLARHGDELVVFTAMSSGKAKRLRNSGRVLLAPCDMRGRVTGDAVEGTARLQDEAETAATLGLIRRRYGLLGRIAFWREGRRRSKGTAASSQVGVAISLDAPGPR
jgi:PPOX class probable F420-dependent enzyme